MQTEIRNTTTADRQEASQLPMTRINPVTFAEPRTYTPRMTSAQLDALIRG